MKSPGKTLQNFSYLIMYTKTLSCYTFFHFMNTTFFFTLSVMNNLVYFDIDQGHKGENYNDLHELKKPKKQLWVYYKVWQILKRFVWSFH